jgi:copper chaperone CopZ
MEVLVFRTNMVCAGCRETVAKALRPFGMTIRWTADLEDCDKVLRVITKTVSPDAIIQVMNQAGFTCEELV